MTAAPTGTSSQRGWPFVGREHEVEGIVRCLAGPGSPGAVLVSGPTGVGKSRLAAEAADRAAERDGLAVLRVTGFPSLRRLPFGAVARLLPQPAHGRGESPVSVVAKLSALLAAHGGGRPVLVLLDNAEQLDPASAGLLSQLVLDRQIRLLATMSDLGLVPDALAALARAERLVELHLRPLGPAAAGRLARAVLGGPADERTVEALCAAAEGNPLKMVNLVVDGKERQALAERDGSWTLLGTVDHESRLAQVFYDRFTALSRAERIGFEYLAFGAPLPAWVLAGLAGEDAVDALLARGMAGTSEGAAGISVVPAHQLYGDMARDLIEPDDRFERCSVLMERVRQWLPASALLDLRLAVLALEEELVVEPSVLAAAAGHANAAHDFALGTRLADAGRAAGGGMHAALELAYARRFSGAPVAALTTLRTGTGVSLAAAAAGGGPAPGGPVSPDLVLWCTLVESQTLAYSLGEVDAAQELLAEARQVLDGTRGERIEVEQVVQLLRAGRPQGAAFRAEAMLADGAVPVEARLRLAAPVAVHRTFAGRAGEALALLDHYLPAALERAGSLRWAAEDLLAARHLARTYQGDLDAGAPDVHFRAAGGAGPSLGLDPPLDQLAAGRTALLRGRALDAVPELAGAVFHYRERDPSGFLPLALSHLAQASALAGDREEARARAGEVRRLRGVSRTLEPELRWSFAWAALAVDSVAGVRAALAELVGWCRARGVVVTELWARHDLLRLGDGDQAEPVAVLAAGVGGAWSAAFAAHATGVARGDSHALATAAHRFERIGAHLHAAEAAAEAAVAFDRAGTATRAGEQWRSAHRLAQAGDGTPTPGPHRPSIPPGASVPGRSGS